MIERLLLLSRHGKRQRLVKHHDTLHESGGLSAEGGPELTVDGLDRILRTGTALRKRYLEKGACDETCLAISSGDGKLSPHMIRVESTGLARTISTATVLINGLVPDSTRDASPTGGIPLPIPVYSRPSSEDYVLRGYADGKCPALVQQVEDWQRSQEFLEKESASATLRTAVGSYLYANALAGFAGISLVNGAVPLRESWNAYDALATSTSMMTNASLSADAEALAAWTESRKFGLSGGGRICGGALLAKIVSYLMSDSGPGIMYYSAHYPVMLWCAS